MTVQKNPVGGGPGVIRTHHSEKQEGLTEYEGSLQAANPSEPTTN